MAQRDGARFLVGASWLGAASASICFCINLLFVEDRAALWAESLMHPVQRRLLVVLMIIAAALPVIIATVTVRRRSLVAVADDLWIWGHRLAPLTLLAPIAPLIDRQSFIGTPITTVSYMLVIGLSAAAIGTRCLEEGFGAGLARAPEPRRTAPARWPPVR